MTRHRPDPQQPDGVWTWARVAVLPRPCLVESILQIKIHTTFSRAKFGPAVAAPAARAPRRARAARRAGVAGCAPRPRAPAVFDRVLGSLNADIIIKTKTVTVHIYRSRSPRDTRVNTFRFRRAPPRPRRQMPPRPAACLTNGYGYGVQHTPGRNVHVLEGPPLRGTWLSLPGPEAYATRATRRAANEPARHTHAHLV